jgi:major membrane immunogen (membrane-anchored lipoprotein)
MIKKSLMVSALFLLTAFSLYIPYKDGKFGGKSRAIYTEEPYYGCVNITIENGRMTQVDFLVRDSAKHVNFDADYERYFAGNEAYILQCRHDWNGIQKYPDSLLKYQDLDKVDAIAGATWSHNLFKASVQEALAKAKR